MSRTQRRDPEQYTRDHLAHAARTRGQRRHDPDADLRVTQRLPAMPLALPASYWPESALERLAADLEPQR